MVTSGLELRTMRGLIAAAVVMAMGCGSNDGAEPKKTPASECDPADRTGLYLVEYAQTAGDCGPIPDEVARLKNSYPSPAVKGCAIESEIWSADFCDLTRTVRCESYATGTLVVETWGGTTTQYDALGATLAGTVGVNRETTTGGDCLGTYAVHAQRQGP